MYHELELPPFSGTTIVAKQEKVAEQTTSSCFIREKFSGSVLCLKTRHPRTCNTLLMFHFLSISSSSDGAAPLSPKVQKLAGNEKQRSHLTMYVCVWREKRRKYGLVEGGWMMREREAGAGGNLCRRRKFVSFFCCYCLKCRCCCCCCCLDLCCCCSEKIVAARTPFFSCRMTRLDGTL